MSSKTVIGRRELFAWVERHTKKRLRDYTDLADGSVFCLLFSLVFSKCKVRPVASQTHSHSQRAQMNWSNLYKGMRLLGLPTALVQRSLIDPLASAAANNVTSHMPPHQHQKPFHATLQDDQHCFCAVALFYFLFNVGRTPAFTAEFQVDLTDAVADYLQGMDSIKALVLGGGMAIGSVPEPLRTAILKAVRGDGSGSEEGDGDDDAADEEGEDEDNGKGAREEPSAVPQRAASSPSSSRASSAGASSSTSSGGRGQGGILRNGSTKPSAGTVMPSTAKRRVAGVAPEEVQQRTASEQRHEAYEREGMFVAHRQQQHQHFASSSATSSRGSSSNRGGVGGNAPPPPLDAPSNTRRVLDVNSSDEGRPHPSHPAHQQSHGRTNGDHHDHHHRDYNNTINHSSNNTNLVTMSSHQERSSSSFNDHSSGGGNADAASPRPLPRLSPSKPLPQSEQQQRGGVRSDSIGRGHGGGGEEDESHSVQWRSHSSSQHDQHHSSVSVKSSSMAQQHQQQQRSVRFAGSDGSSPPSSSSAPAAPPTAGNPSTNTSASLAAEVARLRALLEEERAAHQQVVGERDHVVRSLQNRGAELMNANGALKEELAVARRREADAVATLNETIRRTAGSSPRNELSASPAPRGPMPPSTAAPSAGPAAHHHEPRAQSEFNDLRRRLIGSELPSMVVRNAPKASDAGGSSVSAADALAEALPNPIVEAMSNADGTVFVFDPITIAEALGAWIDERGGHAATSSSSSSSSSSFFAKDKVWVMVSAFHTLQSRLEAAKGTFESLVADRNELLGLVKSQQVELDALEGEVKAWEAKGRVQDEALVAASSQVDALLAEHKQKLSSMSAHHRAELLKVYGGFTHHEEEIDRLRARDGSWKVLCASLRRLRSAQSDEEVDHWEEQAAMAVERLSSLEPNSNGSGGASPSSASPARARALELSATVATLEQDAIALESALMAEQQRSRALESALAREASVRAESVAAARDTEEATAKTCEALRGKVQSLLAENCVLEMRARQSSQELSEVRSIWTSSVSQSRAATVMRGASSSGSAYNYTSNVEGSINRTAGGGGGVMGSGGSSTTMRGTSQQQEGSVHTQYTSATTAAAASSYRAASIGGATSNRLPPPPPLPPQQPISQQHTNTSRGLDASYDDDDGDTNNAPTNGYGRSSTGSTLRLASPSPQHHSASGTSGSGVYPHHHGDAYRSSGGGYDVHTMLNAANAAAQYGTASSSVSPSQLGDGAVYGQYGGHQQQQGYPPHYHQQQRPFTQPSTSMSPPAGARSPSAAGNNGGSVLKNTTEANSFLTKGFSPSKGGAGSPSQSTAGASAVGRGASVAGSDAASAAAARRLTNLY